MRKYEIHRAIAAPECYKFRRGYWFWKQEQYLILYPLTLREWIFIDRVMKKEEEDIDHNIECCFYAVWLSIRKEDHHMRREQLIKILKKYPRAISEMFEIISFISLPPEPVIKQDQKEITGKDELKPITILIENMGFTASQIGDMTPAQISYHLDILSGDKSGRGGVRVNSLHEAKSIIDQMRGSKN